MAPLLERAFGVTGEQLGLLDTSYNVAALLTLIGGGVLIVLGLNMMGVIKIDALWRSWRPLERTGVPAPSGRRLGAGPVGPFSLGAIFAVGWTPCIGPTLGAILGLAALGPSIQAIGLFVANAVGLAVPFLLLALTLDLWEITT